MFFLSVSANFIVYALVSVFFIVCLQIKGEVKISELLPVTVDVSSLRSIPEEGMTYQYTISQEKHNDEPNKTTAPYPITLNLCYSPPLEHELLFSNCSGLRAPPVL